MGEKRRQKLEEYSEMIILLPLPKLAPKAVVLAPMEAALDSAINSGSLGLEEFGDSEVVIAPRCVSGGLFLAFQS
jgi:hypothetical protein